MSLLRRFREYIQSNELFAPNDRLLLAVSGGLDSVVLCELCRQAEFQFGIAHCNFQLRGTDSERDEKFVADLAVRYNAAFHVIRFDTAAIAELKKLSVQETARVLRYDWFEELRKSSGYQLILTAHHADDNIETLLMKFFRGTGIRGLTGILPRHGFLARPLLFARRRELEEFQSGNQLEFVEDYTNQQDDYTRNFFRHQVIPVIERSVPGASANLLANISRFTDAAELYRQAIALHKKKLLETRGREIHLPVLKLKKTTPLSTVLFEIVRNYGFTAHQLPDIMALLDSDTGKYVSSSSHRVIRNRAWLVIAPNEAGEEGMAIIDQPGEWTYANGRLRIEVASRNSDLLPADPAVACLDASAIVFPMILRKWKQGDYFYPLGMKKKKKLARFFIDLKLAKTEKEKVWVLEMDKKIIWVIGYRIDDRFRLTDKTKQVLQIRSIP